MADEFYDGEDYDDYDDYFWVEDGYALADDLAEQVIPDPVYDVVDAEWDELTRFEYFHDIEYDSDGYHDREPMDKSTSPQTGNKRKASGELSPSRKKAKLKNDSSSSISLMPSVMFISRDVSRPEFIVDTDSLPSYSLLPDWQERFKQFIESPVNNSSYSLQAGFADDAPDEIKDMLNDGNAHIRSLKVALDQHLSSLGLSTKKVDRSLLIRLASSMMSGDEEAEDLMADIIESIHEEREAEDDNHADFAEWACSSARNAGNSKRQATDQDCISEETDIGVYPDTSDMAKAMLAHGSIGRKSARADSPTEVQDD